MKYIAILQFSFLIFSCKMTEIKNAKEGYALVINQKSSSTFYLLGGSPSIESTIFRIYPNSKDSLTFGTTYNGVMKNGDKYLITYDSLDPNGVEKQIVHKTKPIFLKSDIIDSTYAVITEALRNKKDSMLNYVEFKYNVILDSDTLRNQTFIRGQQIFSKEFKTLKVGDKYKVVYLKQNPLNAIIYLQNKMKTEGE